MYIIRNVIYIIAAASIIAMLLLPVELYVEYIRQSKK